MVFYAMGGSSNCWPSLEALKGLVVVSSREIVVWGGGRRLGLLFVLFGVGKKRYMHKILSRWLLLQQGT